jgi:hypothetical protein
MQNCPGNIRSIAWSLRLLPSSRSTSRNDWMRGGHTVQEQAGECEVRRINRIPGTGCAFIGVPAIKLISRNVRARAREGSCAIVCIPYHLNGSQPARGLYLAWLRDRVLRQGCRSSSISFAAQRVQGRLSGILIDETEDMPSSSCYSSRFGSLARAYSLIGWNPDIRFGIPVEPHYCATQCS